uniref:Uncharacterized protein n=1 Tax=Scytodes thoracica TaxID=1112478 RepID=A0A0A0V619_SCYTH|nr:hypothetical protein [Scytodes thoracica]
MSKIYILRLHSNKQLHLFLLNSNKINSSVPSQ